MPVLTPAEFEQLRPFLYHTVDAAIAEAMTELRAGFLQQALALLRGQARTRSQGLALTHLEEAQMRAMQGLALRGVPALPPGFVVAVDLPPLHGTKEGAP